MYKISWRDVTCASLGSNEVTEIENALNLGSFYEKICFGILSIAYLQYVKLHLMCVW